MAAVVLRQPFLFKLFNELKVSTKRTSSCFLGFQCISFRANFLKTVLKQGHKQTHAPKKTTTNYGG